MKPDLRPPHLEDPGVTAETIEAFVQEVVADAGAEGVVVNLSGGIDSTVTATLATEALGSERVEGLILPAAANRKTNVDDARQVAEELVVDHRVIDVQPLLEEFAHAVGDCPRGSSVDGIAAVAGQTADGLDDLDRLDRTAVGNVAARLRMAVAYFEANTTDRLVLGTGNRTERLLGYFTKHGDGGVDLLPIGHCYKTEVRDLAVHLGVRDRIRAKPPTAGLRRGQTDESDLGATYETIDTVLYHVTERGRSADEIADRTEIDVETVRSLTELLAETAHKRSMPPTPDGRD